MTWCWISVLPGLPYLISYYFLLLLCLVVMLALFQFSQCPDLFQCQDSMHKNSGWNALLLPPCHLDNTCLFFRLDFTYHFIKESFLDNLYLRSDPTVNCSQLLCFLFLCVFSFFNRLYHNSFQLLEKLSV